MQIFLFWIGDKKVLKNKINSLNDLGFKAHVGPTNEEHNELYLVSKFYRDAFDNKIFSFCSDVWRFKMLSEKKGLYLDVSTVIGNGIGEQISEMKKADTYLFKGSKYTVETGVMFSGVDKNSFFKGIYEYYLNVDLDIWTGPFAPTVLTKFLYKTFLMPATWEKFVFEENLVVDILPKIRDKNSIWKTSGNSWSMKKSNYADFEKNDLWAYWEKAWENKKVSKHWKRRYERHVLGNEKIDIHMLKKYYDKTTDGCVLKHLKQKYLEIEYKLDFDEVILWSNLYRMFSGRWNNTKKRQNDKKDN